MRRVVGVVGLALAVVVGTTALTGGQQPPAAEPVPAWAYPVGPEAPPPLDDGVRHKVPGSMVTLTLPQVRDIWNVADWRPDDHPPMPDIVVHGRRPDVRACGYCHLPNGLGGPDAASLAGLPVRYLMQQVADMKAGRRRSSQPKMTPQALMLQIAKAITDADSKVAAEYFASLEPMPSIKVVEVKMAPRTRIVDSRLVPAGGEEPIGDRIIEVPEDPARTDLRDPAAGWIAYVPPGSLARGEALATTGGTPPKTLQCSVCHGPDLNGIGDVPGIAGRSPTYMVRQLYDMKSGARNGAQAVLMKPVVANLTVADMVAVSAYTASRPLAR
jgi:cytochrome c553